MKHHAVTVISSVFQFNTFGRSGAAIYLRGNGNASVVASEFSHNRAISYGYSIKNERHSNIVYEGCNQFHNYHYTVNRRNLYGNVQLLSINCSRYAHGQDGVCTSPNCKGTVATYVRSIITCELSCSLQASRCSCWL